MNGRKEMTYKNFRREHSSDVEKSFHDLMSCFTRPLATAGVVLSALVVPYICLAENSQNEKQEKEYTKINVVFEEDKGFGEGAKTSLMRYTADDGSVYDEVNVFRPEGTSRVLRDGDVYGKNDGKVDCLVLVDSKMGEDTKTMLQRKDHYVGYKGEFDSADKYLAETKKRFAEKLGSGK